MNCRVCGTPDKNKPMVMRDTDHCSDNHRKVIAGELLPTDEELETMDRGLFEEMVKRGVVE